MVTFGRLLTPAIFLGSWLSCHVVASQHLENAESDGTRLKTYWNEFGDAPVGCAGHVEITYKWRANDWESNLVELLLVWSRGILGGHLDIAVILEPGDGAATTVESGWSPFFLPMPHLCVFDTQQDWEDFLAASGASPEVQEAALSNVEKDVDREEDLAATQTKLEDGGTDLIRSMGMGLDRLLSYMQPSVSDDVRSLLYVPDTESFKSVQYVGMHVRDVPPRMLGTFKATETLDCFERAYKYFEDRQAGVRPSDITGVWIVSEDDTALPEAKKLVGGYFRNAKDENVIQIASPTAVADDAASGAGDAVEYDAVVHLLAQLEVLSSSSIFVGAYSEDFSRLVFLRREVLHHPRATSASVDKLSPFPK